jgi:hypothetical protein
MRHHLQILAALTLATLSSTAFPRYAGTSATPELPAASSATSLEPSAPATRALAAVALPSDPQGMFYYLDEQPELTNVPVTSSREPFPYVYALYLRQPREPWSWNRIQLAGFDPDADLLERLLAEQRARRAPAPQPRSHRFDLTSLQHHVLLRGQVTA